MGKNPSKPYPDFPLTLHRNGQWCKKIRGKIHYFGTEADAALKKYLDQRDDLQAGRQPKSTTGLTLADMLNHYLQAMDQRRKAGELSDLSFRDYLWTAERILEHFGRNVDPERIRPTEFAAFKSGIVSKYSAGRAGKTITVCKMAFRWAYESEILKTMPRFGPEFKQGTKRASRIIKTASGGKVLEAKEIRTLMENTDDQFRAIILLGINCGLGNADISELRAGHLDLSPGWLNFPRPKTGVDRRCPLWTETVDALRKYVDGKGTEDRVFLTRGGKPFVVIREGQDSTGKVSIRRVDAITTRFAMLLKKCSLKRKQTGFYCLRHMTQTIGDEAGDDVATMALMGHADNTISGHYRERIADERLARVSEHIRAWLFSDAK